MDLAEAYNRVIEGIRSIPVDNFLQTWGAYPAINRFVSSVKDTYATGDIVIDTDTGNAYVFAGTQWLVLGEKS